jgi:tryptophanyl-tRNA synthetase
MTRPGVSNLLDIMSGITDTSPEALVTSFEGKTMKDLKTAVGDALEPVLVSFQDRFERVRQDPGYLQSVEAQGRVKAEQRAEETMILVRQAVGLDYKQ